MAKGKKTGGRKKGTPNVATRDVQTLLDKVFAKVDPVEKLVSLLNKPMDAGVEARVLLRLLEYRYGQPVQQIQGPGEDGKFELVVKHVGIGAKPTAS